MKKPMNALRDSIYIRWRNTKQKEVHRDFMLACDKVGRAPAFVLEDLMQQFTKRHARKGT